LTVNKNTIKNMLTIVAIYNKFEFLLSFHEAEQIAVMGKNRRKTFFSCAPNVVALT